MADKTIIDKGNYSFETAQREERFHRYKSEGWGKEYQAYRTNWEAYPQKKFVSEYPLLVDLELSSLCNLKCPMCYTISYEFKQKVNTGYMNFELYKKVVDEIAGKVPSLRLSLRGESTFHPKFTECITYAREKGIKEVSFLTNGSQLNRENFIRIMKAGATWITLSIDGLKEEYERIRKPLKFEETLNRIKEIKRIKEEYQTHQPVIKIQGIWPSIRNNPEAFYNTFAPYVDFIAFNPLIDFHRNPDDKLFIEDYYCPMLYQRLVIGSDGQVMMCSNDENNLHVIGNVNTQSVFDIWHGEELNRIRELHKKPQGYREVDICRLCYLPVQTETNEQAIVNGRTILIRNYKYKSNTEGPC